MQKNAVIFKNGGHRYSKLMGLLIIAGGGLLLSQEYNYIRKEIKKTVGASLNKKGRY